MDPIYLECDPGVRVIWDEEETSEQETPEVETPEQETIPWETVYGEETFVLEEVPGELDEKTNILLLKDDTYHWRSESDRAEIEEDYLVLYGKYSLTTYPVAGRAKKNVVYLDRKVTKLPLAQQVEYYHNGFASSAQEIKAKLSDDNGQMTLYFKVLNGEITEIGSIVRYK
jgi:hypothetical protein